MSSAEQGQPGKPEGPAVAQSVATGEAPPTTSGGSAGDAPAPPARSRRLRRIAWVAGLALAAAGALQVPAVRGPIDTWRLRSALADLCERSATVEQAASDIEQDAQVYERRCFPGWDDPSREGDEESGLRWRPAAPAPKLLSSSCTKAQLEDGTAEEVRASIAALGRSLIKPCAELARLATVEQRLATGRQRIDFDGARAACEVGWVDALLWRDAASDPDIERLRGAWATGQPTAATTKHEPTVSAGVLAVALGFNYVFATIVGVVAVQLLRRWLRGRLDPVAVPQAWLAGVADGGGLRAFVQRSVLTGRELEVVITFDNVSVDMRAAVAVPGASRTTLVGPHSPLAYHSAYPVAIRPAVPEGALEARSPAGAAPGELPERLPVPGSEAGSGAPVALPRSKAPQLWPPELHTGDTAFDAVISVVGEEALAVAVLDTSSRRLAARVFSPRPLGGALLDKGTLRVALTTGTSADVHLPPAVELMARLGRIPKSDPAAARTCLERNAREDEVALVRLRNLAALGRADPHSEAYARALERGLDDVDGHVRLACAEALLATEATSSDSRRAATGVLEALVRADGVTPEVRRAALRELSERLSTTRLVAMLATALRAESPAELMCEALRIVRSHHELSQAAAVRELLRDGSDERVQVAAAEALERLGDASDAALLLEAAVSESTAFCAAARLVAARAVGALGTVEHVAPLRVLAERSGAAEGPWAWPELREVALRSIARIQTRLGGDVVGGLTLVAEHPDVTGAVSLSAADGAVSVVDDSARTSGAVSLPPAAVASSLEK